MIQDSDNALPDPARGSPWPVLAALLGLVIGGNLLFGAIGWVVLRQVYIHCQR